MSEVNAIIVKEVPIMLDKPRKLRFDLNAFANLEDIYGSINDAMKKMEEVSIKAIRALLWCGLVHEEPTLTQATVGSLLGISNLADITNTLTSALASSLPTDEDVDTLSVGVDPLAQ